MRKTRAIIHLGNLRHNLQIIKGLCPDTKLCLAVKADGYGHGAIPIARAALEAGVYALGVATTEEALELRHAGIQAPIILYGIAAPDELESLIKEGVQLFCTDSEFLNIIATTAQRIGKPVGIHLKVDTGMGRIGCTPEDALELAKQATKPENLSSIQLKGICTHFPLSEDSEKTYTKQQISRFRELVIKIRESGIDPGIVHAANSGGIGLHSDACFDMIRPGIIAYGYPPGEFGFDHLGLRPVMELSSSANFIKKTPAGTPLSYGHRWTTKVESWIATIPIGYADGIHRAASGKISVQSIPDSQGKTQRFPQVGTICMDQCLIDLGPATEPSPIERWDEVIIFGPQTGAGADVLAKAAGTISYEITCGISKRVPRVYVED